MDNNIPHTPAPSGNIPGKNQAIASLVCGMIAIVFSVLGYSAILSIILGIVGLVLASQSKKAGFTDNLQTAGFVVSLLGVIFGAVMFLFVVALTGFVLSVLAEFIRDLSAGLHL